MSEGRIEETSSASVLEPVETFEPTPVEKLLAPIPETPAPNFHPYTTFSPRRSPGPVLFIGGVLLPTVAFLIEFVSHICAENFFDPMPTGGHILLVAMVPIANLILYIRLQRDDFEYGSIYGVLCGYSIFISVIYTILYLPIFPIAVFALLLLGMGVLPMTPMLSLTAGIYLAKYLRRAASLRNPHNYLDSRPGPAVWRGLVLGSVFASLAATAVEGQEILTYHWIRKAASADAAQSLQAIRTLRRFGSERAFQTACEYNQREIQMPFGDLMFWRKQIDSGLARDIYYRVTGDPFVASHKRSFDARAAGNAEKYDPDVTGELSPSAVASKWVIENLTLGSSQFNGVLDPDAALGYLEWTMVFKNDSASQLEATSKVELPQGGVVSRLTLWVNGEEREAAFAGKSQVQAAYDSVVRARRDPVLVQSLGGNQISVRCFPVPPQGEMKIRIGVTAPMQFEGSDQVWMRLPAFVDRNFRIAPGAEHSVWFESKQPLESSAISLHSEHPSENLFAVRGSLAHKALAREFPAVRARRRSEFTQAWTADPKNKTGDLILQQIVHKENEAPSHAVLVIDGSAGMKEYAPQIADAVAKLPVGLSLSIIAAGDEVSRFQPSSAAGASTQADAAAFIRSFDYVGGQNNAPALSFAWDLASEKPGGVIIWIHDVQPLWFTTIEPLEQRWSRRPNGPRLYDIQTRKGQNVITDQLASIAAVKTIARVGDVSGEVDRLFRSWRPGGTQLAIDRKIVSKRDFNLSTPKKETSTHLARLWAFGEVNRLRKEPGGEKQAIDLAVSYQLVTPLTGAVVLETKEQYDRAGLKPVDAGTVPTVPEPEEWALIITAMIVLAWMLYQRRSDRGRQWRLS